MSIEQVEVVVVGGGQAGIALSEHLSNAGVPHLILERGRVAEKWRSGRWDSLVANGPAWHDRFPGLELGTAPGAFAAKEQVADYFEAYAQRFASVPPFKSSTAFRALAPTASFRGSLCFASLSAKKYGTPYFSARKRTSKYSRSCSQSLAELLRL